MFKLFKIFILIGFAASQDFGSIFNQSFVIVNVIDEDKVNSYEKREISNLDEQKWYIGGNRINGDALVSESFDKFNFDDMRDFHLQLKYPQQNQFYITHVSCLVEQSSSIGRAYTVEGGVGYNYMTLIFEAKKTRNFYYRIYLFGRRFQ